MIRQILLFGAMFLLAGLMLLQRSRRLAWPLMNIPHGTPQTVQKVDSAPAGTPWGRWMQSSWEKGTKKWRDSLRSADSLRIRDSVKRRTAFDRSWKQEVATMRKAHNRGQLSFFSPRRNLFYRWLRPGDTLIIENGPGSGDNFIERNNTAAAGWLRVGLGNISTYDGKTLHTQAPWGCLTQVYINQ